MRAYESPRENGIVRTMAQIEQVICLEARFMSPAPWLCKPERYIGLQWRISIQSHDASCPYRAIANCLESTVII